MSTSANVLTKPELFDLYVRKFRSICDMHGVQFGSRENLRDFLPKLTEDRHLAMDFWAFTGKISRREEGELSDEQMLAVIVEGVVGGDIPDADSELKTLVDELAALLSGVDVHSHVQPEPFSLARQDSQGSAREATAPVGDEMPSRLSSARVSFITAAAEREARQASSLPSPLSSSPRVVFISEGGDRDAGQAPSLPSRLLSSSRAAFISEGADGEAGPAPSSPPRLSPPHRAVFLSEGFEGEASPARSLPSSPRAVFISEGFEDEASPARSLPSTRSSRGPRSSEVADGEAGSASSSPSTMSSQMVEALRWLQLSSLDLKQHLDEIDKKMSRFEPHLDEPTSEAASSNEKLRAPVEEAPGPQVEPFTRGPAGKSRPDEWPDAELLASAFGSKWGEPSTLVTVEAYAQPRGPHGIALIVALVFVVAGSAFLLQRYDLLPRYGAPLQRGYSALVGTMQGPETDRRESSTNENAVPEARTATTSAVESGTRAIIDSIVNPTATRGASSPPVATANSSGTSRNAQPTPFGSMPGRSASSQGEEPAPSERTAVARNAASGDAASPINVSPEVMAGNLILSRVPAYPQVAKANHVRGPVVVRAIISRSGAVEDVRVIEGNPLLRGAAEEAIYKWRYRPYLINGRPVDVATTITVDFMPNR